MSMDEALSEADLDAMAERLQPHRRRPWVPWLETRGATGGGSFIQVDPEHGEEDDEIYVNRLVGARQVLGPDRQLDADLDFIACARQYVPLLIAEVRRLQSLLTEGSQD
ncbi:hypothetical protein [Streptomyces halobius]|uniref:Uncharacterized protein n=1 Tax=Streptomyces halobius TaxID=2879846 RepID=A0ABY4M3Z7_9ACTN|nr:hypothetical protein [Streptomyces halobius]UQA92132.1 hypothetical protein K9S39_10015 [Streptomyces halobius]